MTPLQVICLAALGIFLTLSVLLVMMAGLSRLLHHFLEKPLRARIAEHYGPEQIIMEDLRANSFGLESAGVLQARGNGALVLTAEGMHFFQFLPKKDFRIPLNTITELSFTKSHLGKATIYDLLKIRFTVDGQSDSIAWYLTDPHAWKMKIEELQAGRMASLPT